MGYKGTFLQVHTKNMSGRTNKGAAGILCRAQQLKLNDVLEVGQNAVKQNESSFARQVLRT